jgi:hypothetical protein
MTSSREKKTKNLPNSSKFMVFLATEARTEDAAEIKTRVQAILRANPTSPSTDAILKKKLTPAFPKKISALKKLRKKTTTTSSVISEK